MSFAAEIGARIRIEVSGLGELERGVQASTRSLGQLERQAQRLDRGRGRRGGRHDSSRAWIRASYHQEQAATQLARVGRAARQGLEQPVRLAMDFEDQMGRVSALVVRGLEDSEARKVTAALTTEARRLGATTRYTAAQAGEGMEFLAMAGYDAQRQIQTMPAVLNLASIGVMKVARSADIATNVMGGFQLGAEESTRVVDRLAAALTSGNVTLSEIGNSMKYLGPVAKAAGQDLESALGWLDILGDAGVKGSQAGTSTREIIARLSSPKGEARRVLRKYDVKTTDDDGNLRDVTQILGELGLAMQRSGKGTAQISTDVTSLVGKRARSSALILMSASAKGLSAVDEDLSSLQGAAAGAAGLDEGAREKLWKESLQSRIGRIRESDGLGAEMAQRMDSTTKGKWREFKSALEETGITIGNEILPLLVELMQELKPVVIDVAKWAKDHPGVIKAMAKLGMATIALTAIATPILHLSSAFSALTGLGMRGVGGFFGPSRSGGLGVPLGLRPRDARSMGYDDWASGGRRSRVQRARQPRAPRRQLMPYGEWEARQRGKDRRRPAGRGGDGMMAKAAAATMGWGIGTMLGEGINWGVEAVAGKTATKYLEIAFDEFDETAMGEIYRWGFGNRTKMSNKQLAAMHGGLTSRRGGQEFLAELNGPTAAGQANLSQYDREKQLAAELGVTYETVRRAREQGIGADELRDRGFLEKFVADEQAKDAEILRQEQEAKRRWKLASIAALEARAEAIANGDDEREVRRKQRLAHNESMLGYGRGEMPGTDWEAVFAGAFETAFGAGIKIKVEGAGVVSAEGEGVDVEGVDTG